MSDPIQICTSRYTELLLATPVGLSTLQVCISILTKVLKILTVSYNFLIRGFLKTGTDTNSCEQNIDELLG